MNEPPAQGGKPADAVDLARIQAETSKAQAVLDQLHGDVAQVRKQLETSAASSLLGVNQQLVLTLLRNQIQEDEAERSRKEAARLERQQHAQALQLLRGANEQLVIAAVTAQSLQSAAEAARRRQTDLLAVVAHELRHPLTPIRNAAAILARVPGDLPVLGRLQLVIEEQVVHMSRLVNDLLDVSRIDTGKFHLQMAPVDLAQLIRTVLDACKPVLNTRRQKLRSDELPGGLQVNGDSVRLTQILTNLLDNASKYTPEGGDISLEVASHDGQVQITISDTGIGITPEALPLVFEPFVQDAHATVFSGTGLGIGLTVVRELVHGHGGTVCAYSEGSGRGSRFVLPCRPCRTRLHPDLCFQSGVKRAVNLSASAGSSKVTSWPFLPSAMRWAANRL